MTLTPYNKERENEWNDFVAHSKNGTFMLDRRYMDYHSDRFEDCSVVIEDKNRIFAVFPANLKRDEGIVYSHQGLTYGGLIMSNEIDTTKVLEAFELICDYYRKAFGVKHIIYKPIPYIYWRQPSAEDEYALWRNNAKQIACGLSTCINLKQPIAYKYSRRYVIRKAQKQGLRVERTDDIAEYWQILNEVLHKRHNLTPVHTAEEMILLKDRFSEKIRLFAVRDNEGNMIAGSYIYIYNNVVHTQYMSATDEARQCGALDLLIDYLIKEFAPTHQWLDFGISTEDNGHWLNEGLIFQKEGFGGRGVCYNQYEIKL